MRVRNPGMASAVWIWLRVSYEAAVKLSARATVSWGHRHPRAWLGLENLSASELAR